MNLSNVYIADGSINASCIVIKANNDIQHCAVPRKPNITSITLLGTGLGSVFIDSNFI